MNLTRAYFADHAVGDYLIVESLGATEGTPASGAADLIVDITTTGATLAANALKILDDGIILESEANLVAALNADWGGPQRRALKSLLDRIAAEERARTIREVRAAVPGDARLHQQPGQEPAQLYTWIPEGGYRSSGTDQCLLDGKACTWDRCILPSCSNSRYTRRFLGGRQPLCGMGVTS